MFSRVGDRGTAYSRHDSGRCSCGKLVRDIGEDIGQTGSKQRHRTDGGDSDQGCDKSIFDHGCAALVAEGGESGRKLGEFHFEHLELSGKPILSDRPTPNQIKIETVPHRLC